MRYVRGQGKTFWTFLMHTVMLLGIRGDLCKVRQELRVTEAQEIPGFGKFEICTQNLMTLFF